MAWMEKGAGRAWVFFAHFQHCERTIRWYWPFNSDLVFQKIRWHCFTWIRLTTFLLSVSIVQKVRSAGAPASNWLRPMLRGEFLSFPLSLRLNAIPNLKSNFNPADVIFSHWDEFFSPFFLFSKLQVAQLKCWWVGGWCKGRQGCPLGGQAEATSAHLPTTKLDLGQYVWQQSCARTSCMAFEFNGNVTSVRLVEVNIDLGIGVMAPSPLS